MLSSLLQTSISSLSPDAAAQMTAGYLFGTTNVDKRDYIVGCFKNDSDLNETLDRGMADFAKGDTEGGSAEFKKADKFTKTAMAGCTETASAFEELAKYEEKILARPDAKEFIDANTKKYEKEIGADSKLEISSWEDGNYFNSGLYAGRVMQYMGLAPTKNDDPTKDDQSPAEFVAGWYYGVEGEDKRDYILGCFKVNEELTTTLSDAMEAYIKGDQKTGDDKMNATKPLFEDAMHECSEVGDNMDQINKKAQAMVARDDWDKISKKIYEDNKTTVDRDVDLELREWKQGVYFNSGMFAGYVEKLFLDNAPAQDSVTSTYISYAPF